MKAVNLTASTSCTLDILRAVSAQLVLFGHAIGFFGVLLSLQEDNVPKVQHVAVVIFILLSGFVISYSVHRKSANRPYFYWEFFLEALRRFKWISRSL